MNSLKINQSRKTWLLIALKIAEQDQLQLASAWLGDSGRLKKGPEYKSAMRYAKKFKFLHGWIQGFEWKAKRKAGEE